MGAGLVIILVAPYLFYPLFLIKVICFCLFACAYKLAMGTAGLLSFGHAAFFGGAAYVAAHAAKVWGFPFELAVLAGTASAGLLGLAFGIISIRRHGIYFAMITLALAQLIYFAALQAPFTHSEDGIQGVPRGYLFGAIDLTGAHAMYYTSAAIFIAGYLIIRRIIHSPFGKVLEAIRDDAPRALSLGYDIDRFRLLAFVLSAALAGLAGATKAIAFQFASLTDVHWATSGDVILMVLLGGVGTTFGPVVGAVVIVSLDEFLADSGLPIQPIIGTIFVLCILLFRSGIVGTLEQWLTQPPPKEPAPS
ncbi:MAG: branched-chain amino acid ABC transporter permease [Xanthobacteraceae bacterium]|nr:branched-chain amino acid ABC transporter permease [Xanthobacteraceae bacterium]